MPEELLLKNCRYVVTMDKGVLSNKDVLVSDGRIEAIGERLSKSGTVVDCSNKIVVPGLVNSHTHAATVLLRGYYDAEHHKWLEKIWSVEAELEPKVVYLASKLAMYEMLSSGTTAFVDMYFYPEETARAAVEVGIRAVLGPVFLDRLVSPDEVIRSLDRLVREYGRSPLVTPIVNVHSIYACSQETLLTAKEYSEREGLGIHMHVSETRREVFECKRRHGVFPVEYLNKLGLLTDRTHLVNLGWITSWEIRLVKEGGASVAHCPASNMKLATAGFFPFKEMVRGGVTVGIGTDGPATNNSLDMFREMRTTVLLQRNNYWDAEVRAIDALRAATVNGGRIIGKKVGKVVEGYTADLVVLDALSLRLQPLRRDNVIPALVYSATGADVAMTIVDGRIVYRRDRVAKLRSEVEAISAELNAFMERVTG